MWAAEGFISGVKKESDGGEREGVRANSRRGMEREVMMDEVVVLQHVCC